MPGMVHPMLAFVAQSARTLSLASQRHELCSLTAGGQIRSACRHAAKRSSLSMLLGKDGSHSSEGNAWKLAMLGVLLFSSLIILPSQATSEIIMDQYGRPQQKVCPVAYFPCWQDGYFCFRPIYCQGEFSPEGTLNAAIIFTGLLAPTYVIWRRKLGLDPDPNTEEGLAFYRSKFKLEEKEREGRAGARRKGSWFSRNLDGSE
uniref:Uncharacterized protein n=1 Tax=Hanusia phi TaxID=3032 RepID=A0A7S0HI93_9CRYP